MAVVKIILDNGNNSVEVSGSLTGIMKQLVSLYDRCPHVKALIKDSLEAHEFDQKEFAKQPKKTTPGQKVN